LDPAAVWVGMGVTPADGDLRDVTPALARFDSLPLIETIRAVVRSLPARVQMPLRQLAWRLSEVSPLLDKAEVRAISEASELLRNDPTRISTDDYEWINGELACGLIPHLSAREQLDLIRALPTGAPLYKHLGRGLRALRPEDLERDMLSVSDQDSEGLTRLLFFAARSRSPLTDRSRTIVLDAVNSSDERLAAVAANLVYNVADAVLDDALLDRAGTAAWAFETSERWFYHGRAIAAAALRRAGCDSIDRVQPRFLGALALKCPDGVLPRLEDSIEKALMGCLRPPGLEPPVGMRPTTRIADEGLEVSSQVSDVRGPHSPRDRLALNELNDMESAVRRFGERQQSMIAAVREYERALIADGAGAVSMLMVWDNLRAVVDRAPSRAEGWIDAILATDEGRLLSQARNLGIAIAGAHAAHDGEKAAAALTRLRDAIPIWDVQVDGIDLYERALFSAATVPPLRRLRAERLSNSFDDEAIESAVFAAEVCGSGDWLTEFVDTLLMATTVWEQALGVTIAGFRPSNAASDRILATNRGTGFLEHAARFARENYERNHWARHWVDAARSAPDAIDVWRFAKLAEGVVDRRFVTWMRTDATSEAWVHASDEICERLQKAADLRSKERGKSLFGLTRPERDLAQMVFEAPA
jgi:hypothetical protein